MAWRSSDGAGAAPRLRTAGTLAWFGYRATDEWQRSAALVVEHRGHQAADVLTRALIRDMQGAQTSILNSPEESRRSFAPPYEANDIVSVAFARYPYPEFFFGWDSVASGTVIFARTDRMPAWAPHRVRADVYPVEVLHDPPQLLGLRERIERDIKGRRRYSTFDLSVAGVPYQVVALISYDSPAREHAERVFGVAVNLNWARDHYFADIVQQVAQIAGNTGGVDIFRDRRTRPARRRKGRAATVPQPAATRQFPVLFFDPAIVAVDPPADLTLRSWTIAASAAGDPTFVLAARGAWRSLTVAGAGVALVALSLIATTRAARASAAVAAVRADFVATVTHELKTPLSTIRAVGETLVRGRVKTDNDLNRYAHLLVREERRLTRLVNNLLAYSRVTDVTEVYSFESVEPAALISEATQAFRRQLSDSEVRIETQVGDVPAVRADRTAIVLALDNLIDNAIRYSGESNTVTVRASNGGGNVRFEVIDQGVGIPAEDLPQVRRRFVRGSTARGPGNGLGLAIVNRIAADHGGALEMASEVGRGTRATLIVPMAAECVHES